MPVTSVGQSRSVGERHPRSRDFQARPSLKTDISYAMVTLGSTMIWSVLGGWLFYFYLPPEGEGPVLVPAALCGAAMFVTRVLNALIALPVGYLSDHARGRWGRRLPFMFFSALPMLLFFVLLWTPPVSGQSMWNLIYLALIYALYNVAYTFNQIPFTALLPELALTDHHRVRMSAWSAGCLLIGMIMSGLAGPVIEGLGYLDTALIYAGIALPLLYLPLLVLHERPERQVSGPGVAVRRMDFWHSLVAVWRNRAFRLITATGVLYRIVLVLVQAAIPFIVTEVCHLTRADTMYFYIPALLASLVCYPFLTWLSDRAGKCAVFAASLLASAVVLPGLMFIGDWFPVALKVQGIVWVALQATAMSGVTMLPPAFGAEVTDHGAARTGQRHEGTYYATWGVIEQIINGAAMALLPLLLLLGRGRSGPHGPLGVRMIGVVGGALMLAAYLVFLRYPLRER